MLQGMALLMTGGDLATMLIALLVGLGIGGVAGAGLAGTTRLCVECVIGVIMLAVILRSLLAVYGRYSRLNSGRCPNPLCHGVVQRSELVGEGKVVCPTCKKTWPELRGMRFRTTTRA